MLGEIICIILFPRAPIHIELFLMNPVAKPVETHIECLRPFLPNVRIEDAVGGRVINF